MKSIKKTNGIAELLVVASIAYTTYVIIVGLQGIVPMVLAAPQALFATWTLVKKFTNA